MKHNNLEKVLFLLSFLVVSLQLKAQYNVMITEPKLGANYLEDDSVKIIFTLSNDNLCAQIYNKLSERIYAEWENARSDGNQVIFGDDTKLSVATKTKKEDESIPSESASLQRAFYKKRTGLAAVNMDLQKIVGWAEPVYGNKLALKKKGNSAVKFVIPIRFSDGGTKDYKLTVNVSYTNPADISKIKIGMKEKEVKSLIDSPNTKEKDKPSKTEFWQYTNKAIITLVKGVVTDIKTLD